MRIYDISQEVFGCCVFSNDPKPQREVICTIEEGANYALTAFSMCAHNGTHIDAPAHFIRGGRTVDGIALDGVVGYAFVVGHEGVLTAAAAERIIDAAEKLNAEAARRILIKGKATVSYEAAEVFARRGVRLLGNESQTVGPEDAPMAVHKLLLGADVVLLEGIRLFEVPEGVYLLNAAPINLGGCEGAPCRAVLIEI